MAMLNWSKLEWMSFYLLAYKHINSLSIFTTYVGYRKRIRGFGFLWMGPEISTWLFRTLKCSRFLSWNNTIYISEVGSLNRAEFFFYLLLYLLSLFLNASQDSSLICSAFNYPYCTQSHLCSRKALNTQFREEKHDIRYCLTSRK